MRMISRQRPFFLLLLTFSFMSCDEILGIFFFGGQLGSVATYPMRVGNRWEYQETVFWHNIRLIDSSYHFGPDTMVSQHIVSVAGREKIERIPGQAGDSIETTIFRATQQGFSESRLYYTLDGSGLFLHGYSGGSLIAPRPPGPSLSYVVHGRGFGSIHEAFACFVEGRGPFTSSIYREYPPVLPIKLPLMAGSRWTFRPTGQPFRIDKQAGALRHDPVWHTNYHAVSWRYDINNDGVWDDDISVAERISEKGITWRIFDVRNVILLSAQGDTIGYFDFRHEFVLTAMDVR